MVLGGQRHQVQLALLLFTNSVAAAASAAAEDAGDDEPHIHAATAVLFPWFAEIIGKSCNSFSLI